MADVKYKVDIDTRGAQTAINGLGNQVKKVGAIIAGAFAFKEVTQTGAKLDDLRRTFGTLFGGVAKGNKAFADTAKLAVRFGIGIEDLSTSIIKLQSAGITPTISQLKLFSDVSKSSVDSVGAMNAITDLFTRTMAGGLGLEDLERLQDRGIPVYTILAEKAGIARSQISELGSTMEGASRIRDVLSTGLNEMFGGSTESRANSMSTAFTNLQNAIKLSTDSLIQGGLGDALVDVTTRLSSWISSNEKLIGQIGGGLARAIELVVGNIKILTAILVGVVSAAAYTRVLAIGAAFVKLAASLRAAATAGTIFQAVTGFGLVKLAVGAGAGALALYELNKMFDESAAGLANVNGEVEDLIAKDLEIFKEGEIKEANGDFSDLNEALKKFKIEQDAIVKSFSDSNDERNKSLDLESDLLGKSREVQELRRAEADMLRTLQQEIVKLQQAKAKLTAEEKKEGRAEIIDKTIESMNKQYAIDLELTESAIKNSQARQVQYELEQYAESERIRQSKAYMDVYDARSRLSMSELEKRHHDIEIAARDSAQAQVNAMKASLGRELTPGEFAKPFLIAKEQSEELKKRQTELYEETRKFSTGWKRAMVDYADDATNAAKTAERVFSRATQGMEDSIVNFAKTGKFEMRGFLNSIVEELLRSQIRQLIASTFGGLGNIFTPGGGVGGGGSGSIFSSIGSLFGFANGGMIPNNSPVLVGERGPELLMNAGGSRVVPNGQLGQTVNYNINAVDSLSFKQMVARDPGFIHAVASQGGKSIPQNRR